MKQSYVEIVGSREHGPTVVFKRSALLEELGKFLRRNDYLSVRGWAVRRRNRVLHHRLGSSYAGELLGLAALSFGAMSGGSRGRGLGQ
jgi:hypothetical protein